MDFSTIVFRFINNNTFSHTKFNVSAFIFVSPSSGYEIIDIIYVAFPCNQHFILLYIYIINLVGITK